jgi:hypothetical protein
MSVSLADEQGRFMSHPPHCTVQDVKDQCFCPAARRHTMTVRRRGVIARACIGVRTVSRIVASF